MKTDICLPSSVGSAQPSIKPTDQYVSSFLTHASLLSPIINSSSQQGAIIDFDSIFSLAY